MVIRIAFLIILLLSNEAFAKGEAGVALKTKGQVTALDLTDQSERPLKRRSKIFDIERISTAEQSQAQLRMSDGALMSLSEQTELVIAEYVYEQDQEKGKVVMELVAGGLRTLTGAIKSTDASNYQVKTPAASIGIRGTHYEIKVVDQDVFFAVWSGAVEISPIGSNSSKIILGQNQNFSFARVGKNGEVETFLRPPKVFNQSFTSQISDAKATQEGEEEQPSTADIEQSLKDAIKDEAQNQASSLDLTTNDLNLGSFVFLTNKESVSLQSNLWLPTNPNIIASRKGRVRYQNLIKHNLDSTSGPITSVNLNMGIDFSRGTVEQGEMSIEDGSGDWFIAFDGFINENQLDVDVNFASHNDTRANGAVDGTFFGPNGERLHGEVRVTEGDNRVQGDFILGQ